MKRERGQLKGDIVHEENQLDIVLSKIKEIKSCEATEINTAALAVYLMNFYNGIENIMKRIAKDYYENMPKGADWHKDLLKRSCSRNGKKALFSKETTDRLYDYLTFRHYFVHGYGFKLKWAEMKALADNAEALWMDIKSQLAEFMSSF